MSFAAHVDLQHGVGFAIDDPSPQQVDIAVVCGDVEPRRGLKYPHEEGHDEPLPHHPLKANLHIAQAHTGQDRLQEQQLQTCWLAPLQLDSWQWLAAQVCQPYARINSSGQFSAWGCLCALQSSQATSSLPQPGHAAAGKQLPGTLAVCRTMS